MENFNLKFIKTLNYNDAKQYLTKYFIPLNDGTHAFYQDGKYQILKLSVIKKVYFNRMSKELNIYYFKEFNDIKTIDDIISLIKK
jgi:hypothetical protein